MKTIALVAVLLLLPLAMLAEEGQEEKATCCFTRDGYQGVCKVQPGEGETCDSILEYLNTPGTVGKSYCGGNKLRGGWNLVDCESSTEDTGDSGK